VSRPDRPNVLFVLTDQQRHDWVGSNPDVPIRTPTLDDLGERGVHFENATCPAPLCAPSRSCLASGQAYDELPITGNENYPEAYPTCYERLRDEANYETIGVGDIDLHMDSPTWGREGTYALDGMGFADGIEIPGKRAMLGAYRQDLTETDHFEYDGPSDDLPTGVDPAAGEPADAYMAHLSERDLLGDYIEDMTDRLFGDRPVSNFSTTRPAPLPEDAYVDNWVGRRALEFLEAAPRDRPWFLFVNFVGPHEPLDVTAEMHGWYRDPDVAFPAPVDPGDELDAETHQEIRRNYAAMCENVDRWLGEYLDAIDARGERQETIVVFASDHGELLGDHGAWTKKSPLRASTGVPLVAAGPGVQSRGHVSEPVSLLDLHATVLEYAGLDSEGLDSRSLVPYLAGETDEHRPVVRSGLDPDEGGPWRLVFDGRYELIVGEDLPSVNGLSTEHESPVLFDLKTDPNERHDVADEQPAVLARLAEYLPERFAIE
jgi:arylsulfatase